MKLFRKIFRIASDARFLASIIAVGIVLASQLNASATVLTFNIAGGSPALANNNLMPQDYGDFANATSVSGPSGRTYGYLEGNGWTPNVAVGYSATNHGPAPGGGSPVNIYKWWNQNNWDRVAYLHGSGFTTASYFTTFVPDSYFGVRVNSFDIIGYQGATHGFNWYVYADSLDGDLLATGAVSQSGTGPTSWSTLVQTGSVVSIDTGLTDFHPGNVILVIRHTSGVGNVFAMDNANFDQVAIPEPATVTLLLGAMGLIGLRRRNLMRG